MRSSDPAAVFRRGPLTMAVAQPALRSFDVAGNALAHAEAVRDARARVVVFPELSLTGYELSAPTLEPSDPRLRPLVVACGELGSVALAGAPVDGDGGRPSIAMLAVDGNGAWVAYRKLYLSPAEAVRFGPGQSPCALTVDGWRLGLGICRDTGIAEHATATVALGIDAYVAGTVKAADEADLQHARGRRIAEEHRVTVAIASFAGSTGEGYRHAAGRSAIWAADGSVVSEVGPEPGAIARATLV